jgi:hypothetical protein
MRLGGSEVRRFRDSVQNVRTESLNLPNPLNFRTEPQNLWLANDPQNLEPPNP